MTIFPVFGMLLNNVANEIDFYLGSVHNEHMYICICNAINERQVLDAVDNGANSLADLQATLGVATVCGCCAETAIEYLPGGRYARKSSPVPEIGIGSAANDSSRILHEVVAKRA